MADKASYEVMQVEMCRAMRCFEILAGNIVGPAHVHWQTQAANAANHLRILADQYEQASKGNYGAAISFPCPHESLDYSEGF